MPIDSTAPWFLRKQENGEIFGPIPFSKICEWAATAQVAPQDMLSEDSVIWTKAPMIPDLEMDWIVKLDADHYYGPTTVGSLLEFFTGGEIQATTILLNCCTGEERPLAECEFFPKPATEETDSPRGPSKGILRLGLQKRIRELEVNLLDKRRQLDQAADTIHRLEKHINDLESRLRDIGSPPPPRP